MRIVDLVDGTAEHIEEAIRAYVADKGLALSKLMGFGSDGAAVMTGRLSGVATRLHRSNPYRVAIHCVAHRLALACWQAGEKVPYVQKFKKSIDDTLLVLPGQCSTDSGFEGHSGNAQHSLAET